MVTKTETCSFTSYKIVPGRGRRFIAKDGRTHYFISTKARSLFHQKIKPVKLTWNQAWRAFNKKIKVDDIQKRRTKKTTRIQKAIVGMSLDEIKRRKAESREERDKNADQAAKEIKERKKKAVEQKRAQQAKVAKVTGAKKQQAPAAKMPKGGAPKLSGAGGKR